MQLSRIYFIFAFSLLLLLLSLPTWAEDKGKSPILPPPSSAIQREVSEVTRIHIDLAYQKLKLAIGDYNQAIQQGVIDERLGASETLRFDPSTEKVFVVPAPQAQGTPPAQPAAPPAHPAAPKVAVPAKK